MPFGGAGTVTQVESSEMMPSRLSAFVKDWSIEATRPSAADVARLVDIAPAGLAIYLSAVPSQKLEAHAEAACRVHAAGFQPVPHIAARRFTAADLTAFLAQLHARAGVRRIMLIAGDDSRPVGPFAGALDVIESGLLMAAGITSVDIAGYPEGHPHLSAETIDRALAAKIEAATRAGLEVHVVSQFCFDAAAIIDWLRALRARGITVPVRIGMAGPTSFAGLMRYAALCGVKTSVHGLLRHGVPGGLGGQAGPDELLQSLLTSPEQLGDIAPHFFSFGGLLKTAEYACQRAVSRYASPG